MSNYIHDFASLPTKVQEVILSSLYEINKNNGYVDPKIGKDLVAQAVVMMGYSHPNVTTDPAKPDSEGTAYQYTTPEIPEQGKFSDDAIDALLFALFGAGLTQAAESVVDQVETAKPRWKVTATSGDITLWVNVDQPQKYIAVGRGKKLGFELPEGGNLPPAELVAHMLDMFGEDVA